MLLLSPLIFYCSLLNFCRRRRQCHRSCFCCQFCTTKKKLYGKSFVQWKVCFRVCQPTYELNLKLNNNNYTLSFTPPTNTHQQQTRSIEFWSDQIRQSIINPKRKKNVLLLLTVCCSLFSSPFFPLFFIHHFPVSCFPFLFLLLFTLSPMCLQLLTNCCQFFLFRLYLPSANRVLWVMCSWSFCLSVCLLSLLSPKISLRK